MNRDRPHFYCLGPGHIPVPCDIHEFGRVMESSERIVAKTEVAPGVQVSTVFLGLDHNFFGDGPPLLFETMIFDDYEAGDHQWRYCTWEEAETGHNAACELVRARIAILGSRIMSPGTL